MRTAATLVFIGRLTPESFVEFAEHRAARLGLALQIDDLSEAAVALSVAGQPDLVDAFEMACSLGPIDCLVLEVERIDADGDGTTDG